MNFKRLQEIVKNNTERKDKMLEAKSYYHNITDILKHGVNSTAVNSIKDNILRNADNRVPHAFHTLLTDEKAAYMFSYPPLIDVDDGARIGNEAINDMIVEVLGESFQRKLKNLCIEATNCGVAWIHYWIDESGQFKYEKVKSEEIIPLYENTLERNMIAVIRYYAVIEYDEMLNKSVTTNVFEYWTDKEFTVYRMEHDSNEAKSETILHNLNAVPFIKFANNMGETSDLNRYKKQIDLFDKVMSGYANDIEDVQQIIYILENFGGQNEAEFVSELKRYKTVSLPNNEVEGKGDLRTLQIDIPVEARKLILDVLKKQIYEFGQGLQQDVESFGNASGVALKFFYRKLELKAGNTETEFRQGVNELIKAILNYKGIAYKKIQQTYTRNMISNDVENAQIAAQSIGIIPMKYILRNHPWIDDADEAEKLMQEEDNARYEQIKSQYDMAKKLGVGDEKE